MFQIVFFLSLENFGSDEAAWWLVPLKNFSTYMIMSSLCYWHLDDNRLDISGYCLADIWPRIEDASAVILELLPFPPGPLPNCDQSAHFFSLRDQDNPLQVVDEWDQWNSYDDYDDG